MRGSLVPVVAVVACARRTDDVASFSPTSSVARPSPSSHDCPTATGAAVEIQHGETVITSKGVGVTYGGKGLPVLNVCFRVVETGASSVILELRPRLPGE